MNTTHLSSQGTRKPYWSLAGFLATDSFSSWIASLLELEVCAWRSVFPTQEETERIHGIEFLPISEPQLAEIQRETAADSVLQCLTQVILQGWPDQKEVLPSELHPYFIVRGELTAQDGILFKGLRCVIPLTLRPKIRERLQGAHTGVEGCLRRARETVYWPGMNADLRD